MCSQIKENMYITILSLFLQKVMEKLANFCKILIFQRAPQSEALKCHQTLIRNNKIQRKHSDFYGKAGKHNSLLSTLEIIANIHSESKRVPFKKHEIFHTSANKIIIQLYTKRQTEDLALVLQLALVRIGQLWIRSHRVSASVSTNEHTVQ